MNESNSKKWSLQDIQPKRAPRRSAEPIPLRGTRSRARTDEEAPVREEYREEYDDTDTIEEETHSLRDIRTPRIASTYAREETYESATPAASRPLRQKMSLEPSPMGKYIRIGAVLAVIVTMVILYIVHVTATAVITIVPRSQDLTIDVDLAAGDGSPFPYAIVTKSLEARAEVPAKGITDLSKTASGDITIYNEYSKEPFALTKNTRFEANGMIFRIQESASVPGYTTGDDGTIIAGKVTAKVFADTPGEAGNITAAQFVVPGLKTDAEQYAKIYARSTEVFTGGFVGRRAVVDDEDKKVVREKVDAALSEQLRSSLQEQAVADQVMYIDSAVITYTDEIETGDSGDKATLIVRGTIKTPVFSARDLAKAVIRAQGENSEGDYIITNPNALTFAYTHEVTTLAPNEAITFKLSGSARLVAQLPTPEIANGLAGITTDELQTITTKYPGIERVNYRMTPAWRWSFPTDPNRITIEFAVLE